VSTPKGRATGYLPGVERLEILPLRFVDGPLGVRDGEAIAFPTPIAIGANCDRSLARRTGRAIAAQASAKGHGVLLAPGLNVTRVPTAGRNFEYLSEDPRLTAELGTAYLRGVQAGNVAATAKHFVANNQDRDRNGIDVVIDERTLREVYLPAFRAAVDAGVGAVMTAYNRVRGQLMSEHRELIEEILRDEWGFEGPTVSDWWGTHDTAAAVDGGLDVEMPGVSVPRLYAPHSALLRALVSLDLSGRVGIDPPLYWRFYDRLFGENGQPDPYPASYFGDRLRHSLSVEEVTVAAINQKVRRVLGLYDTLGHLEPEEARPDDRFDRQTHHELTREGAARGTVLLANDGVLPLSADESLAVIGPNADEAKVGGGGSSEVQPVQTVSPVAGVHDRSLSVTFERGTRRIKTPSMYDLPGAAVTRRIRRATTSHGSSRDAAVTAANGADAAVVVVQDVATEGEDRESMALPGEQNRIVRAVADANPETIVVCRSSGPVPMPWLGDVAAVVQTWYPGQADGAALADVLYGEDPGGRLPVTFGRRFDDYPVASERRYPGVDGRVSYDEGVFVGYRWFDDVETDPLFPFGHGLSYAEFSYDDARVRSLEDGCAIDVTVTNTSSHEGREVVQAYVVPPDDPVDRPPKMLGGFTTVELEGEGRERVTIPVFRRALARDSPGDGWTVDHGEYELLVGRSSWDIRERISVDLD